MPTQYVIRLEIRTDGQPGDYVQLTYDHERQIPPALKILAALVQTSRGVQPALDTLARRAGLHFPR